MDKKGEVKVVYTHNRDTLGIVTLIMGIISLIGSWIPYLNIISIIIAISAIIVGICSMVKFFKKKCTNCVLAAIGIILNIVAICLASSINNSISNTFSSKDNSTTVSTNSDPTQQNISDNESSSTDSEQTQRNASDNGNNFTSPDQTTKDSNNKATLSQQNALKKAKSYLEYSAFSRSGLIKQLEFEKFSSEDAMYAADNCGANWNEQAVKKAKFYLEYSSFSAEGLIDQLKFEGFTQEQATYAIKAIGL